MLISLSENLWLRRWWKLRKVIIFNQILFRNYLSKIKLESFTNSGLKAPTLDGGCVPNCQDNNDCNKNQVCMKGKCLTPCSGKNKCSKMGQSCLKINPANSPDICFEHEDCATNQICIKGKCKDICKRSDLPMANGTCPNGQQCQKVKRIKPMKIKM